MHETISFLLRHGYAVIFFWVLAEQFGLPIPSLPILLTAGALAGSHRLSLSTVLGLAVSACLVSDLVWYSLGRARGHSILKLLCRIALEPDSCVRRTENLFTRRGGRALLIAKFVPGLGAVASPLAGMIRMRPSRFLMWDLGGAVLWAGSFAVTGFLFSEQLERVGTYFSRLGSSLLVLLLGALAGYIVWKYVERQRFIRELRIARITPEELLEKLKAGEDIVVVDLRSSFEFEAEDSKIRGALHMLPEEVESRNQEIPRDRDVVLYCT